MFLVKGTNNWCFILLKEKLNFQESWAKIGAFEKNMRLPMKKWNQFLVQVVYKKRIFQVLKSVVQLILK